MKKVLSFLLNSFVLFWGYFISTILCLIGLQTLLRAFIPAQTWGEYLWKTLFLYISMIIVCVVRLSVASPTYKVNYLAFLKYEKWNVKKALIYILKSKDFWYNTLGFAIWPVILPTLFGVINRLYVSTSFLESFPASILSIITVDVPFTLLSLVAWVIILYRWSKGRLYSGEHT